MQDVLINGRPTQLLDVHDRGLQFGDGLFETLPIRDGRPCLWERHFRRLQAGAGRLSIDLPSEAQLYGEAMRLAHDQPDAVLKLIITRGAGPRGYRLPEAQNTTRVLICSPAPAFPEAWCTEGIRIRRCETVLGLNPMLAGLKHLNRLEQVMARAEWDDPAVAEGLVSDIHGHVIEGTASNLFVQRGDRLFTPRLDQCGVRGVIRDLVIDRAAQSGPAVQESAMTGDDLAEADALYLTNSLVGVWRVRWLESQEYDLSHPTHPAILATQQAAFQA